MEEIIHIATYFIWKGISTSQTMGRWLPFLYDDLMHTGSNTSERLRVIHQRARNLRDKGTITEQIATYLQQYTLWKDEVIEYIATLKVNGIAVLLWVVPSFPVAFKNIPDFPVVLFIFGNRKLLQSTRLVTLVGTRIPTNYALVKTRQLVLEAVFCRFTTVSGLADGIDFQVMNSTMDYEGNSIAIVPQLNLNLLEKYKEVQERVLLISEFPPMQKGISKWQYIARNRLLAGLSPMTIVIEAPLKSGTLHTADFTITYNKNLSVLLPVSFQGNAYGGIYLAQSIAPGMYIQSFYDALWSNENFEALESYKDFIYRLSGGFIDIPANDARHVASIDLSKMIFRQCQENLVVFDKVVIELVRFSIIIERKGIIKFNFSGFKKWPKIS